MVIGTLFMTEGTNSISFPLFFFKSNTFIQVYMKHDQLLNTTSGTQIRKWKQWERETESEQHMVNGIWLDVCG